MVTTLEERLIGSGLVTSEQLARAHDESRLSGKSFWTHLVRLGFLPETELARFLARQLRVPFIALDEYTIDPRVLALVEESLARRHLLLPLFVVEHILFVATANPGHVVALDEVRARTRMSVEPLMATPTALREALDRYYGIEDVFGTTLEYVQLPPASRLTSADTRQHKRVALRLPLQVTLLTPGILLRAAQPLAGELVDLSVSGAMLELPWFLPAGTMLRVQWQPPFLRAPLQVTGRVVHCQARVVTYHDASAGRQRLSLQFVDLDPATETALGRLVDGAPA